MDMRRVLLGLCLSVSVVQAEVMEVRAEPGTDEKLVAAVTKAMQSYNGILKDEMGLELQKSVRIDICPTEESYRNKMYDFGLRGADAERSARSTGGMAFSGSRRILVKLNNASQLKRTNFLAAHEMTHFLQKELSEESSRAVSWLNEGMADFFGALVAQKLGSQSFEKWKLESVNALRRSDEYPMPQDLAEISGKNYNEWREINDKTKGGNYRMADLMMTYLYEQKGRKLFGELVEYQRCLSGTFVSEKTCFAKSLGIETEQFYPQVQAWVKETLAQAGGLEVVANGQDAVAAEVSKNYAVAQALLEEKLGRKLDITMRIILSKNQQERVEQLAEELGLSEEDALKRAKGSDLIWQDSLMFIDTSRSNTQEKRADLVGELAMGRYLQLRAGNINHVYWFYSGLRGWMSAQLQEKLGLQTAMQRTTLRQEVLSKAKAGMPVLSELASRNDWNSAVKKYGNAAVKLVAVEATQKLLDKKGAGALSQWVDFNKKSKGSQDAFNQAFGESAIQFAEGFKVQPAVN